MSGYAFISNLKCRIVDASWVEYPVIKSSIEKSKTLLSNLVVSLISEKYISVTSIVV